MLLAGLTLVLAACEERAVDTIGYEEEIIPVSLYQLVTTPERFEGRKVRVKGYLHLEFEGDGLYPHREDFQRSLLKNGVWFNAEQCGSIAGVPINDEYVLVEGTFSSENTGHMGLWSGEISDVTRCILWPGRSTDSAYNKSLKQTSLRSAA